MRDLRNETLSRFLAAPGRFAIFGAGDAGEDVLRALAECSVKAVAFLDSYVTGERLGLTILPPEDALGLDWVVTAGRHARDMTVQLRADGFEGPVLDLTAAHRAPSPAHFDEGLLDEASDAIGFARSLLQDDGSREVFDGLLRYRRHLDPGDLPPTPPEAGHPAVPIAEGEWVLDIGSDDDSCLDLAEAVGPLGHVHVVAPEADRRAQLSSAADGSAFGARLVIHPLACGGGRRRAGEQDDALTVVTVDELVREMGSGRVDRVRIAGGAVGTVLAGAAATLAEFRPRLEIDLSGEPDDLWELPIRLKEQIPSCRLHLAHHSQGLGRTVCYVQPPESA